MDGISALVERNEVYELTAPPRQTLAGVFASPHSGTDYKPEFVAQSRLDQVMLRRSEDAFVDELFQTAPLRGAPLLKAVFPRAYVDPNREPWELDPAMFARYLACFRREGVIEATCADYRAAATTDLAHDRADADAGRRLRMPLLALWGTDSYVGRSFDVVEVWRAYAQDVVGSGIRSDHYVPEEAPDETARALIDFFAVPGGLA